MLYVHSNYSQLYKNDELRIKEFFDSRSIDKFRYITFVSNESRDDFLKIYPKYKNKTEVFNNFIDVDDILLKSKEEIKEEKPNNKLPVFVGRLDDISEDGVQLIYDIAEVFCTYDIKTEIIAASIRHPMHAVECAKAGADIATIPYKVIMQMIKHPLTDQGIEKFVNDYKKVFG